ncbi:hypothetical protein [Microscilla marina]|uniref:Uncharacterized protein n=1 Tax=Microscilla marina ATCC 23134 TaxID=313606 RepID=A1ZVX2_MICM2|nr:hypothetical protein [Microscilla marina]EAY25454.1 hypothetical protein M23134_00808 [Microscilla marina ATCC 23134]
MNHQTLTLDTTQKMMLALQNSTLTNETNVTFIKDWLQHVQLSNSDQFQRFALQSTHQGKRLTLQHLGNAKEVLKRYATYYQDRLKVSTSILQRLVDLGIDWQPAKMGSWLELNALGVNAGWYLPGEIPMNRVLHTLDPNNHKRRLLSRWVSLCPEAVCLGYGESLAEPTIRQLDLMIEPADEVSTQYYQALHLADLLQVPAFPGFLLEILETYEVQQLVISLWMTSEEMLKFGLRVLYPSNKLLIALCMLAKFKDEDQVALASTYGILGQIQWVEIQQTSDGLMAEISFDV